MDKLELKALGKINLGLDVLGRRENGYHDVRMVMQTLYLYDNVTLQKKSAPGIEIDSNLFYLPNDEDNIAWKAAKLLIDEFDIKDGIGQAYTGCSGNGRRKFQCCGSALRNEPDVPVGTFSK